MRGKVLALSFLDIFLLEKPPLSCFPPHCGREEGYKKNQFFQQEQGKIGLNVSSLPAVFYFFPMQKLHGEETHRRNCDVEENIAKTTLWRLYHIFREC